MEKVQVRGHCQLCGRQQAYLRGAIAKHGYTVEHGYFNGVCAGANYAPMEVARDAADALIAQILEQDIPILEAYIAKVKGGWRPKTVKVEVRVGRGVEARTEIVEKPFEEACDWYERKYQWEPREVRNAERRIELGQQHVKWLQERLAAVHGQPLEEVKVATPARRVQKGDQRKLEDGRVLTADYQDGARVYYRNPEGRLRWIGTQAWRKLEVVA